MTPFKIVSFLFLLKTYCIYYSAETLPKTWDSLVQHDVFLQSNYLMALETSAPNNIQPFYVGVFINDQLVGVAVVQRIQLYLKDMFRKTGACCFKEVVRNQVSKILKGNILVVGNMTHTGQHGVFLKQNSMPQPEFFELIFSALSDIKIQIKKTQKKKIRVLLLKDYFVDDAIHEAKEIFQSKKLYQVSVQPNMTLRAKPEWLTFEDYVSSLNKKYRDRYKRARKKRNAIKPRELSLEDIKAHTPALHEFYMNVSNNAKFNTFILPENHFYNLKFNLQDNFKVFGYFLKDELVGFYTLILNHKSLETYFLGYDEKHQYSNQLYLNMLFDMLKFGVENKFECIVYARTAMEIKSSVGAKAIPMVVYLKHTNWFINTVLKQIFRLMNPSQNWQVRHPFK